MEGMEFKAHKVEQAIELGLKELQIERDDAIIEVISNGGLFSKAVVKITPKVKPEQAAADFINNLFSYMKFDAYASLTKGESENDNRIEITGADSAGLIGYRGETLDSLQYLALLVANKNSKDFVRVSINTEKYREKRKEILTGLAKKLALKAEKTGSRVELEPMNPSERRIIHSALQDSETVTTESVGEDPNRYLVIIPKNPKPYFENRTGRSNGFNREKKYGGRPEYNGKSGGYGSGGYGGGSGGYGERRGGSGGYNSGGGYNKDGGGYNRDGGGYNRDSGYNRDGGYNKDRERGGYGGGRGSYNSERPPYGDSEKPPYGGGYSKPDYTEDGAEPDVSRETTPETEKDYSEVNNNFSNNFKKNGTKNFKSFGYKKR
jgi:spoIIIJ-associated protein